MPVCHFCDSEIPSEAEFCDFCGKKVIPYEKTGLPDKDDSSEEYELMVIAGDDIGKNLTPGKKAIIIGRKLPEDKRINSLLIKDKDATISTSQAQITWDCEKKTHIINHIGGTNYQTLVNGEIIKRPTLLYEDTLIVMGKNYIRYEKKKIPAMPPLIESQKKFIPGKFLPEKITTSSPKESVKHDREIIKSSRPKELIRHDKGKITPSRPQELPGQDKYEKEKIPFPEPPEEYRDGEDIDEDTVKFKEEGHMFMVTGGPDEGRVFLVYKDMIKDKLIIGRKSKKRKDIEISDDGVMEFHGSLTIENDWLCINLENKRGEIFVNNLSVIKKGLEDGDLIELGNTVMEYQCSGKTDIKKASTVIEIIEGPDKGKIFCLQKDINLIGRKTGGKTSQKEIELSSKDKSVSRQHACIDRREDGFYLINGKKDNLTLLNGVQVTEPRPLEHGDRIKVGKKTLLLFNKPDLPCILRGKIKEKIPLPVTDCLEEDMVFIPAGIASICNDPACGDESLMYKKRVFSFYIDRYPVTNLQYKHFIDMTGYKSSGNWYEYFTEGKEKHPVTGVSYNDAMAYASWLGKRLPSEGEWERAARGDERVKYPWGNRWDPKKLNSAEGNSFETTGVDSYPGGASPYGVMDMLGNVWEWTSDYYFKEPGVTFDHPDPEREITIRGGDWHNELKEIGADIRMYIFPLEYGSTVGFRCARDGD